MVSLRGCRGRAGEEEQENERRPRLTFIETATVCIAGLLKLAFASLLTPYLAFVHRHVLHGEVHGAPPRKLGRV